jgi:hypothetical protein
MKTAPAHNAAQVGHYERRTLAAAGVEVAVLERLFESLGVRLVTVKVVKGAKCRPRRRRKLSRRRAG